MFIVFPMIHNFTFYPQDAVLVLVLAMGLCLCVCLSGIVLKWLHRSSWFLAHKLSVSYPILYLDKIGVSPKINVLPSLSLDLENFTIACP